MKSGQLGDGLKWELPERRSGKDQGSSWTPSWGCALPSEEREEVATNLELSGVFYPGNRSWQVLVL